LNFVKKLYCKTLTVYGADTSHRVFSKCSEHNIYEEAKHSKRLESIGPVVMYLIYKIYRACVKLSWMKMVRSAKYLVRIGSMKAGIRT
jgi:hypothetical protein